MPMETRHGLEHTTERLTEGLRCPWKWGLCPDCKLMGDDVMAYAFYLRLGYSYSFHGSISVGDVLEKEGGIP